MTIVHHQNQKYLPKVRKNVSKKPDLRKIVKSSGKKVEALRRSVKSKDKQAREKIIATPVSERSKVPIEIIPMEEYYLKQMIRGQNTKIGQRCELLPKYACQTGLIPYLLTGQYPEGAIMEQRYQYGRAQNAQSHMFQKILPALEGCMPDRKVSKVRCWGISWRGAYV